jgi:hypothetical protein
MYSILDDVLPEGLLMIAASGIGDRLDIPSKWEEGQSYTSTKNCVFIDHRVLAANDIYSRVKLNIVDKAPDESDEIAEVKLEIPAGLIYVGDHLKERFRIFKVNKNEADIHIYGQQVGEQYIVSVLVNAELSGVE